MNCITADVHVCGPHNKQTDMPCQYHYPEIKILPLATNNQEIKNQLLLDDGCNTSKLALVMYSVFKSMLWNISFAETNMTLERSLYSAVTLGKTGLKFKQNKIGMFVQPFLQRKSNKYYIFWVWVCSLTYHACKVHELYIFISGLFFHITSQNGMIFGGDLNIKCVY